MATNGSPARLKKSLGLLDVYMLATGTTLGAGFFLLPGLAAAQAGPAMVIAYLVAAVPLIPAMLSKVELATAMPRAGGTYYFLDRSLGPLIGTIGGLGTWLALMLKTTFALIALGAYLTLFFHDLPLKAIAVGMALCLAVLNLYGSRASGTFQTVVVAVLLVAISGFLFGSIPDVDLSRLDGAFGVGAGPIFATAGLVYVAYIGLTKVISLSEEVENPERNLPLGIFLAIGTAITIYVVGGIVMLGVLGPERLAGDLTPVATTAQVVFGDPGVIVMTGAAVLASISVSNAGLMSASRYPLAMSRDQLMPHPLMALDARGVPRASLALSTILVIGMALLFDPLSIAKLAGAFQLLVFSSMNVALIVMRESHLASYDPGYRSPFYPWLQIIGIVAPLFLIVSMGMLPTLTAVGFIAAGALWFRFYAAPRVERRGALLHVFQRLGRKRFDGLDMELRGILKEKGPRQGDRFDEIVARAAVIELRGADHFRDAVRAASAELAIRLDQPIAQIENGFLEATRTGGTPVEHGVAIPHLRIAGLSTPTLVLVRALDGLSLGDLAPEGTRGDKLLYGAFFLVSPEGDASQHLRFLAYIASRVEESGFMLAWIFARDETTLRELLLANERSVSLSLREGETSGEWIGRPIRDLALPPDCLLAAVHRESGMVVPAGDTVLREGDKVTIIGTPSVVQSLRERYGEQSAH